ncbi:hypothetical protein SUGI_1524790, partial [Cryptomeria japonica]
MICSVLFVDYLKIEGSNWKLSCHFTDHRQTLHLKKIDAQRALLQQPVNWEQSYQYQGMDIVSSEQHNVDPNLCVDNNELGGFDMEAIILRDEESKEKAANQDVPSLEKDEYRNKEITPEFVRENDLPISQKDEIKT